MLKLKSIALFALLFISAYALLLYKPLELYERYADFFRNKANSIFSTWGDKGQVVIQEELQDKFDTKIIIGNKEVFFSDGQPRGGFFMYSIRYRGFMASMLLIALFSATPISIKRRLLLMLIALIILHIALFFNLYIMILDKYNQTPELALHQYSPSTNNFLKRFDDILNNGFGFTFFLVAFLWIGLISIYGNRYKEDLSAK